MLEVRVCVDVDDLEKGIAFYTRAFDLRVGRRLDRSWVELLGARSPIDLLAEPAGSKAAPTAEPHRDYRRHWTPVHLDFCVSDLDVAVERATHAGATLDREVQDRPWGRMANMADPFGNGFCLLELRGRGYDEIAPGTPSA
jgi:predicted enzyme related to lactoylglutathione lyase